MTFLKGNTVNAVSVGDDDVNDLAIVKLMVSLAANAAGVAALREGDDPLKCAMNMAIVTT